MPTTPSFLEPHPDIAISVYLIIRLRTTPVADSTPTKPWFQLSDASPSNMPYDIPEDNINHRYEEIHVDRMDEQVQEVWKIRLEYAKAANDGLEIMGYAHTFKEAEHDVEDLAARHVAEGDRRANEDGVRKGKTVDNVVKMREYVKLEHGKEVRYFWEIIKVALRPVRTYGIKDAEKERERVHDLEWRYQEWAKKKEREDEEEEVGDGRGRGQENQDGHCGRGGSGGWEGYGCGVSGQIGLVVVPMTRGGSSIDRDENTHECYYIIVKRYPV